MKVAVVQHGLRGSPEADVANLVVLAARAADDGADVALLPDVPALCDDRVREDLYLKLDEHAPGADYLIPDAGEGVRGRSFKPAVLAGCEELGLVALSAGDASLDLGYLAEVARANASVLALAPQNESELQVEAVLEFALALSESVAPLILVSECVGAAPGIAGHGGSAIVLLGEVIAEADVGDDVIMADVHVPIPRAEPPTALPELPPILAQRLAAHEGRRLEAAYPADLP